MPGAGAKTAGIEAGATPIAWRRGLSALSLCCAALAYSASAQATPPADAQAPAVKAFKRSQHAYPLPDKLTLQRADGRLLGVRQALTDGRPVVMTFMYSSCTTVCPITNQTLIGFGQLLGAGKDAVNLVSISIDPDHDSVTQLKAYAKKTGTVGGFYTSDPATSESVQRIFDVWRGDKMHHQPVFLLSTHPDKAWVRLDGFVSPRELFSEYQRLIDAGG